MSENLQKYSISVEFDAALAKINKVKEASSKFNKAQEATLKTQIALQRQLNTLKGGALSSSKSSTQWLSSRALTKLPKIEQEINYTTSKAVNKPRASSTQKPKPQTVADKPLPEWIGPQGPVMPKSISTQRKKELAEELSLEKASLRVAQQKASSLEKAKFNILNSKFMMDRYVDSSKKATQEAIKRSVREAKTVEELRRSVQYHKSNTSQLKKQNFLMQRMNSSSKQMMGNMVSAFAIAAGAKSVVSTGQEFDSINNTMLAVSANSTEAGENFKFVQGEALRLGISLKESAKGFAKMAAARGDLSLEDTKKAFTGIAEMGTLLGLSTAESGRAINALQQMMSKGVVSSEELKLQMGEVLPNALPLMAKAAQRAGISVSGTVKEMFELQKQGKLISSQVLPYFADEMDKAARANGGLDKAVNSNRASMGRMIATYEIAANAMYKSGTEKGLTKFFKSVTKFIKDNSQLWKSLGKIIGSVLSGVSHVLDVVTPVLSSFGTVLSSVTDMLGDASGLLTLVFVPLALKRLSMLTNFLTGTTLAVDGLAFSFSALYATLWPIVAAMAAVGITVGALEEVSELYNPTGKKTLVDWKKFRYNRDHKVDPLTGIPIRSGSEGTYSFNQQVPPSVTVNNHNYIDGDEVAEKMSNSEIIWNKISDAFTSDH